MLIKKRALSGVLAFLILVPTIANLAITNVIGEDNTIVFTNDFSNASQVLDQYGAFYSNRDVWCKSGSSGTANLSLSIKNIEGSTGLQNDPVMYVSEKTDWARPVIRFSKNFEIGKTYLFEYDIKKEISNKNLKVNSLIQITGSKDGNWPTAPDVTLEAIDIGNDWQKISFEMKISTIENKIAFTVGNTTTKLPDGATLAALDYSISTSGDDYTTPYYIDNFKVSVKPGIEYPTDPNATQIFATDFETNNQYIDSYFDYSQNKWMKVGNGGSASATLGTDTLTGYSGASTTALKVTGRTDYARPVIRLNIPFEKKKYRFNFDAISTDASKVLGLQPFIEITGYQDGGYPTAPALDCGWTMLTSGWVRISVDVTMGENEEGGLTYTANGKTVSLPAGATLAAFDFDILSGGTDATTDYYFDNFTVYEVTEPIEPTPYLGIVGNTFRSNDEIDSNEGAYYSKQGVWSVNSAGGTINLSLENQTMKITNHTGNARPEIRLGGSEKIPTNKQYTISLDAKNSAADKNQSIKLYIELTGQKLLSTGETDYKVIGFYTDAILLNNTDFAKITSDFYVKETDKITVFTSTESISFDAGYTIAAMDVGIISDGTDKDSDYYIDNFMFDYLADVIYLDFEDSEDINDTDGAYNSDPYKWTKVVYGAKSANIEIVPNAGINGSNAMRAIGSKDNWRPEMRLSQGTAKVKVDNSYEISFMGKSALASEANFQLIIGIYYTLPGAPTDYKRADLFSTVVTLNSDFKKVTSVFNISQTAESISISDGVSKKDMPANAEIAAVDLGFVPTSNVGLTLDYLLDDFKLTRLVVNPISEQEDESKKIIKNGGFENAANVGTGRAWYAAENADYKLEVVTDNAYSGKNSLKVSDRKLVWHRAIQRLEDPTVFKEGKKYCFDGTIRSEEDTIFSIAIYITVAFKDAADPSKTNYAAIELPLETKKVTDEWQDFSGEFGVYKNENGNLVFVNAKGLTDLSDAETGVFEVPGDSMGIAAIDVYFNIPEDYSENITTTYYIDNMEINESGTYVKGDKLNGTFINLEAEDEPVVDVNDTVLFTDDSTGIVIKGNPEKIELGATFVVEKLTDGSIFDNAKDIITKTKLDPISMYSIKLMLGDKQIQPNGCLKVVIPAPVGIDADKSGVVVINENNLVDTKAKLENGQFLLTSDLINIFAITKTTDVVYNVNTGDKSKTALTVVIGISGLITFVVFNKRKKRGIV